jgi:hypothetical protein
MRPLPPEFPITNVRWALDVLSLRRFFSSDPLDTLNESRIFAVDNETTLTDGELIALHHLGRLNPEGVRALAAERRALLHAFRSRHRRHPSPEPAEPLPSTEDRPRGAAAAAGAGASLAGNCTDSVHDRTQNTTNRPESPHKGHPKRGT